MSKNNLVFRSAVFQKIKTYLVGIVSIRRFILKGELTFLPVESIFNPTAKNILKFIKVLFKWFQLKSLN